MHEENVRLHEYNASLKDQLSAQADEIQTLRGVVRQLQDSMMVPGQNPYGVIGSRRNSPNGREFIPENASMHTNASSDAPYRNIMSLVRDSVALGGNVINQGFWRPEDR